MSFCYGANLGPAQAARHLRGQVSAHELSTAGNKHVTAHKLDLASADVTNAYVQLDITRTWGDGSTVGTDGSQIDTWENNLLAETSPGVHPAPELGSLPLVQLSSCLYPPYWV